MSIKPRFKTSQEAKQAGWFSRRHETNKEQLEVKQKREQKRNQKAPKG